LGPKRATKIRRLFNLSKDDDVRKYVLRKTVVPKDAEGKPKEGAKSRVKAPKIQRLVTPARLQRKRRVIAEKQKRRAKNREELANYQKVLAKYSKVCLLIC
jgi:small subunit ribosomal protein S6e